jgi:hypothetical protein
MFAMALNREKKIVLTSVLGPYFLPPKETPCYRSMNWTAG